MIVLWILLGILALLALLLMLSLRFHVVYREELSVTLRVLGIPFPLYPRPKARKASSRPSKKKKRAAKRPQTGQAASGKRREPTGIFTFLRRFLRIVMKKCRGYLRIRVKRLCVAVATDDPAKTAILFGAVNAAVVYLLELLDRYGNWDGKKTAVLSVQPDFSATKTTVDVHLVLSLRVWQALAILFHAILDHLENQKNQNKA